MGIILNMPVLAEFSQGVANALALAEDEAIMRPENSVKARFLELLARYPELTRPQAYMQAVMENAENYLVYRGYVVPPELAPKILARLENNDHQANLD